VERSSEWSSELFDLLNHPSEQRNALSYRQNVKIVQDLQQRLRKFFEQAGAPSVEE
jgi:hypothetical protein